MSYGRTSLGPRARIRRWIQPQFCRRRPPGARPTHAGSTPPAGRTTARTLTVEGRVGQDGRTWRELAVAQGGRADGARYRRTAGQANPELRAANCAPAATYGPAHSATSSSAG